MAGVEQGRWRAWRQWHLEARRARARHRPVTGAPPRLTIHAVDPATGATACGFGRVVVLSTAWEATPVRQCCLECLLLAPDGA